jgi:SAM-dependent methyltransferase
VLSIGGTSPSGFLWTDAPDAFLDLAEESGWRAALESVQRPHSPDKLREALAPNRITWASLIDLDDDWLALDIGAGTGGVACQLARKCSVVALDRSWCDAAFIHLRGAQDGLLRLESVAGDAVSLPFRSRQFDLAVMIGALEWVPTVWPEEAPRETQLEALREALRVLKPGGHFFLGIENRNYAGYFLGQAEPHTGIEYISLLERDTADRLSNDLRGAAFLEVTHSHDEYVQLLKEAGFVDIQAFWLYPDYRLTLSIVPLGEPGMMRWFVTEHLDPRDFPGPEFPLYSFHRFLDPETLAGLVRHYGFLARCPEQE